MKAIAPRKTARAGKVTPAPSLPEISKHIRKAQAALIAENERMLAAVGRWNESRKYSNVEIGWDLLRAVVLHRSDTKTRFKSFSTGVETLSTPARQPLTTGETENGGFYAWLKTEHADIEPRTARNWMNAARNAGLTAESAPAEVAALRRKKALEGIALAKLYRAVAGDEDPQPSLADRAHAQRLMAEITFTHGRSGLLHRLHETVIESALFAHLSGDQIERLYHTLAEATDKVAEHRPQSIRRAD